MINKDVVVQLLSCVQLISDPMDSSQPGSSVHRISQARILEWVAISFSRGSLARIKPSSPVLAGEFLTTEPSEKPIKKIKASD